LGRWLLRDRGGWRWGIGLQLAGGGDAGAGLGEVGLLWGNLDNECGGAGEQKASGKVEVVSKLGEFLHGDAVGLEEFGPDGDTEAGVAVASDEVVLLGHADGGVAVVVGQEYLEVAVVDGDGAELLEVLREAFVAFNEDGAARSGGVASAGGIR
jgi:hypothetical protein